VAERPSALQLDRLIHEPLRLGVMAALAASRRIGFIDLKERLDTTDGNLSAQARKLETAGYLTCHKSFEGRIPRTEYEITPAGRKALAVYLAMLDAVLRDARRRKALGGPGRSAPRTKRHHRPARRT